MKLILFDIDGTLLDSGEAGAKSLNLAFEELFSIRDAFQAIHMAGKTDIQIMREGLIKHGLVSEDEDVGLLCKKYIKHLLKEIENPRRHVKPGVQECLEMLSDTDDMHLGLLTGNIETGARIKLSPFGLNSYFPFGAFGNDDEDRNKLLPIAAQRFRYLYQKSIDYRDCCIIGDTPRDVECAKIHGARAIAVATGPYPYESLTQSGADLVLRDLTEMDSASLR
ncbi:MAG: HAD family hydrolase [Thermodesulfovibrionales bacterium]|jgi:phosphoglycolate phosphatase-like HAD superfamily hydrolase